MILVIMLWSCIFGKKNGVLLVKGYVGDDVGTGGGVEFVD